MSDEQSMLAALGKMNPWWASPASIDQDGEISRWRATGGRYIPALVDEIRLDFGSDMQAIYTVRGSRQVGKTTMAKLQIKRLLDGGTEAWRILYYSFGPHATLDELYGVLLGYLNAYGGSKAARRRYVFLDEISYVPRWQEALKDLSNRAMLVNCTIVATGSNATDLTRATETLTGRMGLVEEGNHQSLLPMDFRSFVSIMNRDLAKLVDENLGSVERRAITFLDLVEGKGNGTLGLSLYTRELEKHFMQYLVWGGIPHISNMCPGQIPSSLYKKYLDGILNDWKFLGYGTDSFKNLAVHVVSSTGSTFSWDSIASSVSCSRQTAQNYLYALRDMYVISITDLYDVHSKSSYAHKSKKLHTRDPIFYHVLDSMRSRHDPFEQSLVRVQDPTTCGRLAECVMADHLVRFARARSRVKPLFDPANHVFYWRSGRHEVDFVYVGEEDVPIPIEVKWRSSVSHKSLGAMAEFLDASGAPRGLVATRSKYDDRRDYAMVPLPVILMLL